MDAAEPHYTIPSRKYLSSVLLPQRASLIESNLKHQMLQDSDISLTIDLWSSRDMRSFIGITGHFVKNFVLESVMVACKRFKGRHTAENIYEMYEDILSKYNLGSGISTIITDNAANIVKAFTLPGLDIDCVDSDLPDDDQEGQEMDQLRDFSL